MGTCISIDLQRTNSGIVIAIRDEGVGIQRSDISKLFQKFKRLPNPLSLESNGSGLGLYWAKKVLEYHDGEITVSSQIGCGSTFIITLPKN